MKRNVSLAVMLAGGALLALLWPGGAEAQPEPTMVISPSSGPCDATLDVTGTGFESSLSPAEVFILYLIQPGTRDISMGTLNPASVDREGSLTAFAPLGPGGGCAVALLDAQAEQPSGRVLIAVSLRNFDEPNVRSGERIPNIIAVAEYRYTTTAPPRQPMMVLSPSSGPCDAIVDITGRDFPPSTAIRLDVVGARGWGTQDELASLVTDPNGTFLISVQFGALGCQAATAIEQLGEGPDEFWVFADLGQSTIPPGSGAPPILTRTAYTYTTTSVSPAPPALPSTGDGPGGRSRSPAPFSLIGALAGLGVILLVGSLYCRRLRS